MGRTDGLIAATLICLLTSVTGGCGDATESDRPTVSVRDSAGVRIVESAAPAGRWTVSGEPVLDIGGSEAGEGYQLYDVRGVVVLSDGRMAVANAGSKEVLVYGSDGEYLEAWGGPGEGPGEFLSLSALGLLPGDTVAAFDLLQSRLTLFDGAGAYVRTVRMGDAFPGAGWGIEILADGRMLLPEGEGFGVDAADGVQRRGLAVHLYDPATDGLVTLGTWPGSEWDVRTDGSGVSVSQTPFSTSTHATARDDRVHVGYSGRYEIETFDGSSPTRIVRLDAEAPEVTEAMFGRWVDRRASRRDDPDARRRIEARFRDVEVPERLPYFSAFFGAPGGRLWVRRYPGPGDARVTWDVIDADGTWRATIELPTSFAPQHVDGNTVLGVWRDALDVEHVVRYGLDRSAGDPSR